MVHGSCNASGVRVSGAVDFHCPYAVIIYNVSTSPPKDASRDYFYEVIGRNHSSNEGSSKPPSGIELGL